MMPRSTEMLMSPARRTHLDARVKPAHDGGGYCASFLEANRGSRPMITAVVQFTCPSPSAWKRPRAPSIERAQIRQPAGIGAQILSAQRGRHPRRRRLSVADTAAAEAVYNGEWKARVKQLYGSEPEIAFFDTPVIVDNRPAARSPRRLKALLPSPACGVRGIAPPLTRSPSLNRSGDRPLSV